MKQLDNLKANPPASLENIYTVVQEVVECVAHKLEKLEHKFYQDRFSAQADIRFWMQYFQRLSAKTEVNYIGSILHVERITYLITNDYDTDKATQEDLAMLKDYQSKFERFVPSRFYELVGLVKESLHVMDKYCLSFINPTTDPSIETCKDYEAKRMNFYQTGIRSVDNITVLSQKFKTSGVDSNSLSAPIRLLGTSTDCLPYTILLIFPECCRCIRESLEVLRQWVKEDQCYAQFLQGDLSQFKSLHQELNQKIVGLTEQYHQLKYRTRFIVAERTKAESEQIILKDKEAVLAAKEDGLATEEMSTAVQLETQAVQKYELEKLKRDKMLDISASVLLGSLPSQIRSHQQNLREVRRELNTTRLQLRLARRKIAEFKTSEVDVGSLYEEMRQISEKRRKLNSELTVVTAQLEVLRTILLFKTTPDTLEKIFRGMPTRGQAGGSNHSQNRIYQQGHLEIACDIVASEIDEGWVNLYRNLPFFPQRGQETICTDIYSIRYGKMRDTAREQAKLALKRWRRFHTRARLDDLRLALIASNKQALWDKIDRKLFPPAKVTDPKVDEELRLKQMRIPSNLLPYYEQVERFDQLRPHFERLEVEQLKLVQSYRLKTDLWQAPVDEKLGMM